MLAAMDTFRLRFSERLWRISPMRLAGPSLDKELRTASRHKRTYGYRLLYVVGLLLMVLPYWTDAFYVGRTPIPLQQARMAEGVIHITSRVMWFQFLTLPMASVILLSGAFSEEIAKRTLGVLMTTPISGFQMVAGKLLSALSQLVMLMLLSVPILMIMGIYGGLDWRFIAAATGLTICCSLTAGLMTVWVSTYFRRATVVIIVALLLLTMVYIVVPQCLPGGNWLGYINPLNIFVLVETSLYQGMYYDYHDLIIKLIDDALLAPWISYSVTVPSWVSYPAAVPYGLFCIFQAMVSFGLLIWSAKRVRKKGYQLFSGQSRLTRWFTEPSEKSQRPIGGKPIELKPLRTVTGNAMIWKELRTPMLRRRKLKLAAIVSPLVLLNAILFLSVIGMQSQARWLETMMPLLFIMIGLSPFVLTLLFSAGAISSEKENGTWPILLATPLSAWTILLGKIVGIIKKTCVYWLSVMGLLWILIYVGQWHPVTFLLVLPIAGQLFLWICASGLFWGSLVRKTATSVVLTLLSLVVCWGFGTYVIHVIIEYWCLGNGFLRYKWLFDSLMCLNPFVQLGSILQREYSWPLRSLKSVVHSTVFLFAAFVLYSIMSFVLLAITQRLIRRRIF